MKAVVYTEYGTPDFLQFADLAKPIPKHNEVLIRSCDNGNVEDLRTRSLLASSRPGRDVTKFQSRVFFFFVPHET